MSTNDFVKLKNKSSASEGKQIDKEKNINDSFVPKCFKEMLNDQKWENILKSSTKSHQEIFYTKRLADFIELHHPTWHYPFPPLIRFISAQARGCDAVDSEVDKGTAKRIQNPTAVVIDTAFGYKSSQICLPESGGQDDLARRREDFCTTLVNVLQDVLKCPQNEKAIVNAREVILKAAKEHFPFALGETRWAANDVTLWDHSYSVASFYKALLAKVLIEGKMPSNLENVNWRILRVAFDGLAILSRARRIGDILGYREMLDKLKGKIKAYLESEFPVGNELYRDETGIYFVVPDLEDEEQRSAFESYLRRRLIEKAQESTKGEVMPLVDLSEPSRFLVNLGERIGDARREVHIPHRSPDSPRWALQWKDPVTSLDSPECRLCSYVRSCNAQRGHFFMPQREICPVCQARPKCEQQEICKTCLKRREERAEKWLQGEITTIWLDEVADHNQRLAIVTGRFGLLTWLEGKETYSLFSMSLEDWKKVREDGKGKKKISSERLRKGFYEGLLEELKLMFSNSEEVREGDVLAPFFEGDFRPPDYQQWGKEQIRRFYLPFVLERSIPDGLLNDSEAAASLLAHLLLKKHPSPARVRRFWETTERFWEEIISKILDCSEDFPSKDLPEEQGAWRTRRLILKTDVVGEEPPALAYEGRLKPKGGQKKSVEEKGQPLSIYWHRDKQEIILTDNLLNVM